MRLRMRLTRTEARELYVMMLAGVHLVNEELGQLERLPLPARDLCYGPGILPATRGVRDDMLDLLADAADALSDAIIMEGSTHGTTQIL